MFTHCLNKVKVELQNKNKTLYFYGNVRCLYMGRFTQHLEVCKKQQAEIILIV